MTFNFLYLKYWQTTHQTSSVMETTRCYELNRSVPVSEAFIITLGDSQNFVVCKEALGFIQAERRTYPCLAGEEGLDVYKLSFCHGSPTRGDFLFSVGKHPQIFLPRVEAALSVHEKTP